MTTILLVVGILVLLIVAHEFGHFLVAKLFRVKVVEFGVGYPPRALTFGVWGGTEYTVNWIPFGGFVRLFGDEGQGVHGRGSFVDASRMAQFCILAAGVVANALMGWVLFSLAFYVGIPQVVSTPQPGVAAELMIATVVPGSPADAAGLIPGDRIISIGDSGSEVMAVHQPSDVVDFVKERGGKAIEITYTRAGVESGVVVTPAHAVIPGEANRPALGVELALVSTQSLPFFAAVAQGLESTLGAFKAVGVGLYDIVRNTIYGASPLQEVVGPVGLVGVVGNAAENGFGNVLALAAFISVNLAIINLLPIPALDGGRIVLVILEAVMRRNAPRIAIQLINTLGVALIVFLMITVTYNDIARLLA